MTPVRIREAAPEDAPGLIALFETLYAETKSLLREPCEAVPPVEQYAERIVQGAAAGSEAWLVAERDGRLVGVCVGRRGSASRNRHALFLVMGVLQAWWGRGVGRALLQAVEQWAVSHGIHRLELTVSVGNARARSLYEKCGFEREGTRRDSLMIDGEYVDELYMAKLLA